MGPLSGKIALVTGASRGAGRGIACVLGEAGATVYVTGRSTRGGATTDGRPETIEETAERVEARGGRAVAVRCDHESEEQVAALLARIGKEHGRLDVLVNNVWGGYEKYEADRFDVPFWEFPMWRWDRMFNAGARAHFLTSRYAAPLMIEQRSGLIVNTTFWDRDKYFRPLPYSLAKTAINRLAYSMALELRPFGVAAVAVSPGWMRTEGVMEHIENDPEALAQTESPEYIGRAIAALAADPELMRWSGQTLTAGGLAEEYGFTDVDGRLIPAFRIPEDRLLD